MKCFNVLDLHYIFYFHFRHPKCYLCLMLTLIFLHVLVLVASPPPQVLSHEDLGKFLRLNQFSLLGSQPISAPHTAACLCPDTAACLCPYTYLDQLEAPQHSVQRRQLRQREFGFKPTALLRILSRNPASIILTEGIELPSLSGVITLRDITCKPPNTQWPR